MSSECWAAEMGWIIGAAVLWGMWRLARRVVRACAQRELDRGAQARAPRVAPPPRMTLLPRELPAAAMAVLAGPGTRARLRLIMAVRRGQSLDRYYERLDEAAKPAWDKDWNDYLPARAPGKRRAPVSDEEWLSDAVLRSFAIPPAQLGFEDVPGFDGRAV